MAILGLLVLAAATALGVETVLATRSMDATFTIWGQTFTAHVATVFLLGAVVMACAILGVFLVTGSLQHRRSRRVEAKHRVREERLTEIDRTNADLVAENDRLRAELAAERRAAATMGGVAVPPGAGNVAYGDQVGDAVRSTTIEDTGHYDPYPTDSAPRTATTTPEADTEESEEKAGILGRFRGNG